MDAIKYQLNGRTAYIDPARLYRHAVSGSLHVFQTNGRLRDAAPEEIAALELRGKALDDMTRKELEAYAKENFGVDLDRRKTKAALLSEIQELAA